MAGEVISIFASAALILLIIIFEFIAYVFYKRMYPLIIMWGIIGVYYLYFGLVKNTDPEVSRIYDLLQSGIIITIFYVPLYWLFSMAYPFFSANKQSNAPTNLQQSAGRRRR
jgi:uncharacterized membrane protein